MRNYVQPGDFLTLRSPSDVKSGEPLVFGALVGIAAIDAKKDGPVTIATEGVFELPKVESEAVGIGILVRLEEGLVTMAEKGVVLGFSVEEAPAGARTVKVKLR